MTNGPDGDTAVWYNPEGWWFYEATGDQEPPEPKDGCGGGKLPKVAPEDDNQSTTVPDSADTWSEVGNLSELGTCAGPSSSSGPPPLPPTKYDCTHRQSGAMMYHGGKEPVQPLP